MVSIESKNKKLNFISGLFKTKAKAERIFQKINQKKSYEIIEQKNIHFPFFIIERKNKFEYYQCKEDIQRVISKIEVTNKDDEDIVYCNLYIIEREYAPKNPNDDSMGILDHVHVDNEQLKNFDDLFSKL